MEAHRRFGLTDYAHCLAELIEARLGLDRTDGVVVIQVTEQGRDEGRKKALDAALAQRREADAGVRPSDLVISIASNAQADWPFGLGRAQFLEGDL